MGQAAALVAVLAAVLALGGCERIEQFYTTRLPIDTPIDWWHQLQGGVIAEERPPAPGIDDPYPNLASVPPRPVLADASTRRALLARLAAERDRSAREAVQDPIATPHPVAAAPVPPAAAPVAPSAGPAAAPSAVPSAGLGARVEAATAVPAPPPPRPAAAPPPPPAIQAAASPTPPSRQAAAAVVSGPVPALPVSPPPPPVLPGVPAATTAPAVPRARPEVVAAFVPASAVLRPESDAALRALAARRGDGPVAVLGGGDARSAEPAVQAAALSLAWRRARAMADVLVAAGVPVSAMRIDAAALARDGIARLVE